MGIIIIDKDAIMSAEVLKCDLTIDTEVYDISALTRYIKNSLSNYDAYVSKPKRNGNLELEKKGKTISLNLSVSANFPEFISEERSSSLS